MCLAAPLLAQRRLEVVLNPSSQTALNSNLRDLDFFYPEQTTVRAEELCSQGHSSNLYVHAVKIIDNIFFCWSDGIQSSFSYRVDWNWNKPSHCEATTGPWHERHTFFQSCFLWIIKNVVQFLSNFKHKMLPFVKLEGVCLTLYRI